VLEDDSEEEGTSAKKARKNDLHPPTVLTLDEEGDAKIKKVSDAINRATFRSEILT
jgi:hypothetical protein